jgi:hypothetical protein
MIITTRCNITLEQTAQKQRIEECNKVANSFIDMFDEFKAKLEAQNKKQFAEILSSLNVDTTRL